MFVIVSPLTKLSVNKNWFNSDEINVDSNFIYETNIKKIEALTNRIKSQLETKGILNSQVVIYSNVFSEDLIITSVYVDLNNSNVNLSDKTKKEVVDVVTSILSISESEVMVYGR